MKNVLSPNNLLESERRTLYLLHAPKSSLGVFLPDVGILLRVANPVP